MRSVSSPTYTNRHQALPRSYKFVWVVEDDVGLSGSWRKLLHHYGGGGPDLLCSKVIPCDHKWFWRNQVTPAFKRRPMERLWHREHVVRLSAPLLDVLHDCSLRGEVAFSEMSIPTLCAAGGLAVGTLDPAHVGKPFKWDGVISEATWRRRCAQAAPGGVGQLFHKLDF